MPSETQFETKSQTDMVLDRLERGVRRSQGFTLAFVKCNHPAQREAMRRALLGRLSDKHVLEVDLKTPIVSLLDVLTARWDASSPPDAVCVYGLEGSINEQREASPVLGRLNNDRELLRRAIPVALLIWLPDFALDCVARGAPDFWAWRSGVYEFPSDRTLWHMDSSAALNPDTLVLYSLTVGEKRREIARLEELLRTASVLLQQDRRERETTALLLHQLGLLHMYLGEWDVARARFQESLPVWQELDDQRRVANALYHLGMIEQDQGNLEEATRLYRQSLHIDEMLGHRQGVAACLHVLGTVLQDQGNAAEAERLFERSLQIMRELGNKGGIATSLHHLGRIQQDRGDMEEAEQFYRQSLRIAKEVGDKSSFGSSLHQLGITRQSRGDLEAAQRFYEEGLQIAVEVGDKNGIALGWGQLGVLLEQQGQLRQALLNYVKAWALLRELGSAHANLARQHIVVVREQVGDEQFEEWLKADCQEEASQILRALEEEIDHSLESPVSKG